MARTIGLIEKEVKQPKEEKEEKKAELPKEEKKK